MAETQFLLNLKALIWSVYVAYTPGTVEVISRALDEGVVDESFPEIRETHLGQGLRFLLRELPDEEDRRKLSLCIPKVKSSQPSLIYRNMVIEVGHYVVTETALDEVPYDCHGVVYCLDRNMVHVLFRLQGKKLAVKSVLPFQIMPVYTLTIPEL